MRKDEICGENCFDGSPTSFWYDHLDNNWVAKDNDWFLEEDTADTIDLKSDNIPKWLERYNCNGECKTYLEVCNGGCDHPDRIMKGGITLDNSDPFDLVKCGKQCRKKDDSYGFHDDMRGFHDCGDECLSQSMQCNGICPNSTLYYDGPQWKCGNECRPGDTDEWRQQWRACPDGSCRDWKVKCDNPLPGSCPTDKVLCRYDTGM